jgi:hypothetical protein
MPSVPIIGLLCMGLLLSGCSTPGDIRTQFVSPDKFQGLSCKEIGAEGERVARRVAEISGLEHDNTGAGFLLISQPVVVEWPSAVIAKSDDTGAELGRLKGEFEALERASTFKRCGYHFKQQRS